LQKNPTFGFQSKPPEAVVDARGEKSVAHRQHAIHNVRVPNGTLEELPTVCVEDHDKGAIASGDHKRFLPKECRLLGKGLRGDPAPVGDQRL
jgi:hypothetical protein